MTSDGRPTALVTGGAKRVGRAIALAFAAAGCDVVVTYRSSETEANALAEEIRGMGVTAHALPLDLSRLEDIPEFASRVSECIDSLAALVHNASIYDRTPLDDLTIDDLRRHADINAFGPLLLTRALLPLLRRGSSPSVTAMADIHAMGVPRSSFAAYSMSKAALAEMVRSLAIDLAPDIRVNGVAPGVVAFPDSGYESDEATQQAYLRRVPLERTGTPEDAAEAVVWLALKATYCTGQFINVDGGRRLR
ncbi:MAG: SDR family oxidoreductase [Phycisphaerales bacterium]